MSKPNKDILKTISEKFIKNKEEPIEEPDNLAVLVSEKGQEIPISPTELKYAVDVVQLGREFLVVKIKYDLTTKRSEIVEVMPFDNKISALSFELGKNGILSIAERNKRRTENAK